MFLQKTTLYCLILISSLFSCFSNKNEISEENVKTIPSNKILTHFTSLVSDTDTLSEDTIYSAYNSAKKELSLEERLLLLERMGDYFYRKEKPDSALKYFQEGLKLSDALDDTYYQSVFRLSIGTTYFFISKYDSALEELRIAYDLSLTLDSTLLLIKTSRNLGNAYWGLRYFDKALDYYFISLDASEKADNWYGIASALNNIGSVYQEVKDFNRSIEYSKKAINIAEKEGFNKVVALANNNIGNCYLFRKMYDSALIFFNNDLDIERHLNSKYNIGISLGNIAKVYLETGNLEKAREYFNESLKNALETGDKTGIAIAWLGIAESYIKGDELNKVEALLYKGFELSKEINSLPLLDLSYRLYSNYYYVKKDFKTAHKYLALNNSIKDSINSLENAAITDHHDHQYKVMQKELEIFKLRQRQKNFFEILIIGLTALVIISILIYTSFRQKIKSNRILSKKNLEIQNSKNELEKKHLELLKSQAELQKIDEGKDEFLSVISHDLKNPLSAIRGFVELMIKSYDDLSDAQRKTFLKEIFNSIERLGLLINNMLLWVKSQAKGLKIQTVEFNLSKRINDNIIIYAITAAEKEIEIKNTIPQGIMVISDLNIFDMIIRNLLSNSLKFTNNKGHIVISAEKTGKMVRLSITDNGIGIPPDKVKMIVKGQKIYTTLGTHQEQGTGLGLGLVSEFIHKIGGSFNILSEPGKGTTVIFDLPSADK